MFNFPKIKLIKILVFTSFFLFVSTTFANSNAKLDSLTQELSRAQHDTTRVKTLIHIAGINSSNANYKKSIGAYQDANKIYIKLKDRPNEAEMLNSIAVQYYYLNNWDKAIEYFSDALKLSVQLNKIGDQARFMNNIGMIYQKWGQYNKSLEYLTKALVIKEEIGDSLSISRTLNNIALNYTSMEKYNKAIEFYHKSLSIKRNFKSELGLSLALQNLGWAYYKHGKFAYALKYVNEGLDVAKEKNNLNLEQNALIKLGDIYDATGDYEKANGYIKLSYLLKDSIDQMNNAELIAEMDAKYEAEKKDNEIALQQVEIEKEKTEAEFQSTQKIWFAVGLVLALVLLVVALRSFQQKKKANLLLEEKNAIIEEKNKDITDSITYASSIQQSILPDAKQIAQVLPEHLIFYKPKDIVSGDFYWFHEKEDFIFMMAADCTGHGVPGAFVSMLCNNLLNQVIIEKNFNDPGKILTEVNRCIINSFRKKGAEFAPSDGMDCSLCVINKKTKQIIFSGAYNQLVIVNKGELREVKADRTPIGGRTDINYEFKSNTIQTEPDDRFYIFSDGYADQFGGPKGKKFMIKSLKKVFVDIHNEPMQEQHRQLDKSIISWIGDREQIDDILIIGFQV